jgi:hypothetical protein
MSPTLQTQVFRGSVSIWLINADQRDGGTAWTVYIVTGEPSPFVAQHPILVGTPRPSECHYGQSCTRHMRSPVKRRLGFDTEMSLHSSSQLSSRVLPGPGHRR